MENFNMENAGNVFDIFWGVIELFEKWLGELLFSFGIINATWLFVALLALWVVLMGLGYVARAGASLFIRLRAGKKTPGASAIKEISNDFLANQNVNTNVAYFNLGLLYIFLHILFWVMGWREVVSDAEKAFWYGALLTNIIGKFLFNKFLLLARVVLEPDENKEIK